MNRLTDNQKAYIAGIIDGEGCIHVGTRRVSAVTDGTYQYVISTQVSMCHEPIIRWLHSLTGIGRVYTGQRIKGNRKRQWAWMCSSNATRELLSALKPFLIVKLPQCELVLELLSIRAQSVGINRVGGDGNNRRFNPRRQFEIYGQMKVLNHRGQPLQPQGPTPPQPNANLVQSEGGRMTDGADQIPQGVM